MPTEYSYEHHVCGNKMEGANLKIDYVYGFSYTKVLYTGQTQYQKIELLETPLFGKLLKLDGNFQTSEKDEFFYHEPQTHSALSSHPHPSSVLTIGGGDGGILKNVLKHKCVSRAVLVDIDAGVIEFSMKYLKSVCGNAFQDKRTQVIVGDGKRFVEETKEKFDVIILDLTDPIGPSKALYTKEFYAQLAAHLNKNGIVQLHMEMCITRPGISRAIYKNLKSCFKYVAPSSAYVPLYGGLMAFGTCSQTVNAATVSPATIERRLKERKVTGLKMYNGAFHQGLFALPNYLATLFT